MAQSPLAVMGKVDKAGLHEWGAFTIGLTLVLTICGLALMGRDASPTLGNMASAATFYFLGTVSASYKG